MTATITMAAIDTRTLSVHTFAPSAAYSLHILGGTDHAPANTRSSKSRHISKNQINKALFTSPTIIKTTSSNTTPTIPMRTGFRMTKSLPEDLLPHLLEHLRDDKQTLYNCLFVSRLWCRHAAPILWRNPFGLLSNTGDLTKSLCSAPQKAKLFRTYATCLTADEKTSLIKLLKPFKDHLVFKHFSEKSLFDSRPTFQYERWLDTLNDTSIQSIISASLEPQRRRLGNSVAREEIQTFKLFLKMFATRATCIRRVGLESLFSRNAALSGTFEETLALLARRQRKIESISLLFKPWSNTSSTTAVSSSSSTSGRMSVNVNAITDFIKSQRTLKDFWCESARGNDLTSIMMTLRTYHASSLETFLFTNCSFTDRISRDYFGAFTGLRDLVFSGCEGVRGTWFVICSAKTQKIDL